MVLTVYLSIYLSVYFTMYVYVLWYKMMLSKGLWPKFGRQQIGTTFIAVVIRIFTDFECGIAMRECMDIVVHVCVFVF